MKASCFFSSPIGMLRICEENEKIAGLSLVEEVADNADIVCHSLLLQEACRQLTEYFDGQRKSFTLPLQTQGTDFQKKVWAELEKIPYGETRSYEDIAIAAGNKKAVRAVGQANNKNPLMIFVPCHRVIHKNGDIRGFACGTEAKAFLLELEKKNSYFSGE